MASQPVWLCLGIFIFFLFIGQGAEAGSYCRVNYWTTTYCPHGCCGSSGDRHCCDWSPTVGLIIGCVFAGIAVVSLIIALVCCCLKKKAHSGKVIHPTTGSLPTRPTATTTASVTHTTIHHHNPHQMAAFFPGTGVYQPPPGYTPHRLPPLANPPAYQPPAPPPAYDIYGTTAAQEQQYEMAAYSYGQGGGGVVGGSNGTPPSSQAPGTTGVATTSYGNNYVV